MSVSRQREWLIGALEGVPSIVFLALWRSGIDLQIAGWTGSILAAALLIGFRRYSQPNDTIVLGINLHLLIATPLIEAVYRLGGTDLALALIAAAQSGLLVSILAVGAAQTVLSPRGYIGDTALAPRRRRLYSLALLAATAAAAAWSLANHGNPLLAFALPLMALFALRRFLIARARDRSDNPAPTLAATPAADVDG